MPKKLYAQNMTREERIQNLEKNRKEPHRGLKKLIQEGDTSIMDNFEVYMHGVRLWESHKTTYAYDDPDIIMNEIQAYIAYCDEKKMNPTWLGLSLWLGVTIQTLDTWKEDRANRCSEILKKTHQLFHSFLQQKALDGQLNPLMYFFMAKNYWGLSDKTEIVHSRQTTTVIDISEQQRILNSTPGVVIDADFSEKPSVAAVEPPRTLETGKADLSHADLQNVLRGRENVREHEDLETCRHGDLHTQGDLETWRLGDLHTQGDLETWRLGDLQAQAHTRKSVHTASEKHTDFHKNDDPWGDDL